MTCHVLCVRWNIYEGEKIYAIYKERKKKNITDQPADD